MYPISLKSIKLFENNHLCRKLTDIQNGRPTYRPDRVGLTNFLKMVVTSSEIYFSKRKFWNLFLN